MIPLPFSSFGARLARFGARLARFGARLARFGAWLARLIPPDGIFSGRPLQRNERILVALPIALAAGIVAFLAFMQRPDMFARDFTYPWWGGEALLAGLDPYEVIRPVGPSPRDMYFMYPLTAAIVAVPFAFIPVQIAGALFTAIGAGIFAFVLSKQGLGRWWVLLSAPFGLSLPLAQWSPLLTAAALSWPLAWLLTCKPNLGLALFAYRPNWRSAAMCAGLLAVTLLIDPVWFPKWVAATRKVPAHAAPVTYAMGLLPLLALLRWRKPEARLVAAMAIMPQNIYFYDQVPLWLAARTGRQSLALTALSWVAWIGSELNCVDKNYCGTEAIPWVIGFIYLPATALVLFDKESAQTLVRWRGLVKARIRAS